MLAGFSKSLTDEARSKIHQIGDHSQFDGRFDECIHTLLEGQVLLEARQRNGNRDQLITERHTLIGKSVPLDKMMEYHCRCPGSKIVFYDIDLAYLTRVLIDGDVIIRDWWDFEKAMNLGWRYNIPSLVTEAINYADNTPIDRRIEQHADLAVRLMRQFRLKVCSEAQVKLLNIILQFPIDAFKNPGSLITQSFETMHNGDFNHITKATKINFPMTCSAESRFQTASEPKLTCCTYPRPYAPNRKQPMYCSKCKIILCTKCQRNRCLTRLLSFIDYTFYIRTAKIRTRPPRLSREPFNAVGKIFPYEEFGSLEDSLLFKEEGLSELDVDEDVIQRSRFEETIGKGGDIVAMEE